MYGLLFVVALALLALGIRLTWLRSKAQQESKAMVEEVLDLSVYLRMREAEAALPYFVDSGNNLHWRNES